MTDSLQENRKFEISWYIENYPLKSWKVKLSLRREGMPALPLNKLKKYHLFK